MARSSKRKLGRKEKLKDMESEFKNIRTIELVCLKSSILEKILWISLGIIGIAWVIYFIPGNYQIWKENPSIKMQEDMQLSEIKYPAISILPSGIFKYAIAERLANYLDPKTLAANFRKLRTLLLKCSTMYMNGYASKAPNPSNLQDYHYWEDYYTNCLHKNSNKQQRKKLACKVNNTTI